MLCVVVLSGEKKQDGNLEDDQLFVYIYLKVTQLKWNNINDMMAMPDG